MSGKPPAPPRRRPLPDHLGTTALVAAATAVVVDLLVAALATSRASAHVLSPLALGAIVAGAAASGTLIGYPNGLFGGVNDVAKGDAVLGCAPGCPAEPDGDPFTFRRLWGKTLLWTAVAAAWAGAGAGLIAVALDGKRARLVVLFVALLGLAGAASVVVDTVARHRGAHAARALAGQPVVPSPLRRRAWRQIGLPLAAAMALANAGSAWVLFHDYRIGDAFAPKALTRGVAIADLDVVTILLAVVVASIATAWGRADAALGRIALDDPEVQDVPAKAPIGWQATVYASFVVFVVGNVLAGRLPGTPTLLEVAILRGAFSGVLVLVVAALTYVRGAVNQRAAGPPIDAVFVAAPASPAPAATASAVLTPVTPREVTA